MKTRRIGYPGICIFHLQFIWLVVCLVSMSLVGCASSDEDSAPALLRADDSVSIHDLDVTTGQTIFVPAYSSIYYETRGRTIDLAATLVIHNTDFENPIVVTSVRYFDARGELVQEYLAQPLSLNPLTSTDFYVDADSKDGKGIGTNFVVEWVAESPVHEPIVEAIMLSTTSAQGISFTSPGRVIRQILREGD